MTLNSLECIGISLTVTISRVGAFSIFLVQPSPEFILPRTLRVIIYSSLSSLWMLYSFAFWILFLDLEPMDILEVDEEGFPLIDWLVSYELLPFDPWLMLFEQILKGRVGGRQLSKFLEFKSVHEGDFSGSNRSFEITWSDCLYFWQFCFSKLVNRAFRFSLCSLLSKIGLRSLCEFLYFWASTASSSFSIGCSGLNLNIFLFAIELACKSGWLWLPIFEISGFRLDAKKAEGKSLLMTFGLSLQMFLRDDRVFFFLSVASRREVSGAWYYAFVFLTVFVVI